MCFRLLDGEVAMVTGATGSLGRVITKILLENGAKVVTPYRTLERQEELANFVDAFRSALTGIQADVTNAQSVQDLLKKTLEMHGHVDILLNIVSAYVGGKDVAETKEDEWDFMMATNLKSVFLCSKAVLPTMIQQNFGRIVSVAARPAVEKRFRVKSGAYAVSKAGVVVLTETMAEEVKKYDINVNCVMPSTIDTPSNRRDLVRADSANWVKPEDIAKVILFLVSDDSKATSGAAIPVYGKV
jgi:NAD(P)-dependent dehydrogenase (short-subunit alcohol dehydrogenase family)